MRKIERLILILALVTPVLPCRAQVTYDQVSATIVDSVGHPYANASIIARLVDKFGNPLNSVTTPNGQPFNGRLVQATLDATGYFSIGLVPNSTLKPAGTQWALEIRNPQDTAILDYEPSWRINYTLTVTGAVDLSSELSAVAQPVSFANLKTNQTTFGGGSGGITQITGDVTTPSGSGSQPATLATVNGAPGTCGDATHVCQVTTNGKGLTTAQSSVAITAGGITLTTTGTSGAATLTGDVLNIPQYQAALTLTTTGTSGPATLSGGALNIPQYSGGGGSGGLIASNSIIALVGDSINQDDTGVLAPHIGVSTYSCDGVSTCTFNTSVAHGYTTGQYVEHTHATNWATIGGTGYSIFKVTVTSPTQYTISSTETFSCASSCGYTESAMNFLGYAISQRAGMPSADNFKILVYGGPNLAGTDAQYSTYLHPISPAVTGQPGYLLVNDYNNDLYGSFASCGSTAPQIEGFLASIWTKWHTDLGKVVGATMIGRDQSNSSCPTVVATAQAVNRWIRQQGTPITYSPVSTTATASSGATSLTVASGAGVFPGMVLSGPTSLQVGTQVGPSYTVGSTTVPITLATTGSLSATAVTLTGGAYWDSLADLQNVLNDGGDTSLIASNGGFGPSGVQQAASVFANAMNGGAGMPLQSQAMYSDQGFWHNPTSNSVNGDIWTDAAGNPIWRIVSQYDLVQVEEPTWNSKIPFNVYSNNGSDIRGGSALGGFVLSFTPSGHGSQNSAPIIIGATNTGYSQGMIPNQLEFGYNWDNSSATNSAYLNIDRNSQDAFHALGSGALCVDVAPLRNNFGTSTPGCPSSAAFSVGTSAQFQVAFTTGYPTVAGCASGSYLKADGSGCATPSGGGSSFPFTIDQTYTHLFNNGTSFSVTLPHALQASGATAYLLVCTDGTTSPTTPSGWTLDLSAGTATGSAGYVYQVASAGQTSVSWTTGGTASAEMYLLELGGTRTLDTSATASNAGATTGEVALPTITPASGSAILGFACYGETGSSNAVTPPGSPLWANIGAVNTYPSSGGRSIAGVIYGQSGIGTALTMPVIHMNFNPSVGGYGSFSIK